MKEHWEEAPRESQMNGFNGELPTRFVLPQGAICAIVVFLASQLALPQNLKRFSSVMKGSMVQRPVIARLLMRDGVESRVLEC